MSRTILVRVGRVTYARLKAFTDIGYWGDSVCETTKGLLLEAMREATVRPEEEAADELSSNMGFEIESTEEEFETYEVEH